MGAIVLSNYCGVAGDETPLSAAVGVSGCYDASANGGPTPYARTIWHPWLALELKRSFLRLGLG